MKLQMSFGENLINLRKQKGWSQDDLADNLNLSRQAISKWENETSKPDIDNIKKISKIFSVKIDDLLNNDVVKDKAVTLNVKKQEKKEKTITIVKCMIIAVIILYIINVIFKFTSLLIIVNGIQKYANLSNYHYVITTYEDNKKIEVEEGWFKDGILKNIVNNYYNNDEEYQLTYINFNENEGYIESKNEKVNINIDDFLSTHLNFNLGNQFFLKIPIVLRKLDYELLLNGSIDLKNNINLYYGNTFLQLEKDNMLPKLLYSYNEKENKELMILYSIQINSVDEI